MESYGKNIFSFIEKPKTTVEEDVNANPALKQKLLQAKRDILHGKTYTTAEVAEKINRGEL